MYCTIKLMFFILKTGKVFNNISVKKSQKLPFDLESVKNTSGLL